MIHDTPIWYKILWFTIQNAIQLLWLNQVGYNLLFQNRQTCINYFRHILCNLNPSDVPLSSTLYCNIKHLIYLNYLSIVQGRWIACNDSLIFSHLSVLESSSLIVTYAHYTTNRLLQRLFPLVSSGCTTAVIGSAAKFNNGFVENRYKLFTAVLI
jgi:hypothetical protein